MQYDIINIDSRNRNTKIYANSNSFTLFLSHPLKKIHSIELLSVEIPVSFNNVTISNNVLGFRENNSTTIISITIPIGVYNLTSFASTLQTLMNSNTQNGYVYTVNYLSSSNAFTINSTGIFTFDSITTTCYKIIGYNSIVAPFSTSWTSTNACDIINEKYMNMKLNNIPFITRNSDNNYFAKIQIPTNSNTILYNGVNNTYPMKRYLNDKTFILNKLDIQLSFYNDIAVDLKGLDWSATIAIQFEE